MNKNVFFTNNTYFVNPREIMIQSYLLLLVNAVRKSVIATRNNLVTILLGSVL